MDSEDPVWGCEMEKWSAGGEVGGWGDGKAEKDVCSKIIMFILIMFLK